ncbi:MAG: head GIN domain-containing protein [Sphingorhabdus sp.]
MKNILALAAILSLSACGYSVFDAAEDIKQASKSGMEDGEKITAQSSTLDAFTKLASIGPDNITFEASDSFTIQASGDADVIAKLRYKLEDGRLVIGRVGEGWSDYKGVVATIHISAPTLSKISNAGSGNIIADALENDEISIAVAGAGNVIIKQLKANEIKGSIAGSGNINVAGTVQQAKYAVAGSGNIDAKALKAATAKASIAGSGDVDLFAHETAKASIAGSGDVSVTGGAKCTSSIVGSGELNCS